MRRIAALLLAVGCAGAAGEWRRYGSPHFELYSDAREAAAQQALRRLELIRHVFLDTVGPRGAPLPVRAFLFDSERDFSAFRPHRSTRGFYQSGPERDSIAMLNADDQTMRVVFHEYVHLVLNHSAPPLPRWLEEGTAEYYSTLRADGDRLTAGAPIAQHLRTLGVETWLEAAALAAVNRDSPYYNETAKAGLFYAQSWALVHMLNLAAPYRRGVPHFFELLARGAPAPLAFEQAFARSLEAALEDLRGYLASGRLPVVTLAWKPPDPVEITVEAIAEHQAEVARIELLLELGRHREAEPRLRRLERSHADSPEVLTELARFAIGAGRRDEARRLFERAIERGSTSATTYFEYAMLLRDAGEPRERVRELLAETTGRNPRHAEAHFILGLMASQDGDERAAIGSFEQAAAILPRQSYFWHGLAISNHRLGRSDEARRAARRALDAAATPQQLEMARAALRLVAATPEPPGPARRPDVVTPKSWQMPRGDTRIEGVLEHIDCLGANARFHLRVKGAPVALWVANPGQVLLNTPSSLTFVFQCGPQKPRPVAIEYVVRPDAMQGTVGDIRAIEFR
jgi:tetratricopeptide (TPR) repeat protein